MVKCKVLNDCFMVKVGKDSIILVDEKQFELHRKDLQKVEEGVAPKEVKAPTIEKKVESEVKKVNKRKKVEE